MEYDDLPYGEELQVLIAAQNSRPNWFEKRARLEEQRQSDDLADERFRQWLDKQRKPITPSAVVPSHRMDEVLPIGLRARHNDQYPELVLLVRLSRGSYKINKAWCRWKRHNRNRINLS